MLSCVFHIHLIAVQLFHFLLSWTFLVDRTFPAHPYFSQHVGVGQFALFNLLKVYSNLDPELGYCQGLSFVAGLLLMHVSLVRIDSFWFVCVLLYIQSIAFFAVTDFDVPP